MTAAGALIQAAQPQCTASPAELDAAKRRMVYDLMSRDVVSDRILSAYFARSLHAADQWLHFRRELAGQVALASFLSFIMSIGDRGLHKLQISRSSARVQQLEFCPTYNDQYFAFNTDTVPFRMTRNMTELLGPALLDGVFAAGMTGAAACVARNQEVVKNFFCLFMRDDLVSFHATRLVFQSDPDCQRLELQLRDRISANVRQILKRAQNLMPSPQQPADGQRVCVVFVLLHLSNFFEKLFHEQLFLITCF
jgi:transformation/transcription domain-associated protein